MLILSLKRSLKIGETFLVKYFNKQPETTPFILLDFLLSIGKIIFSISTSSVGDKKMFLGLVYLEKACMTLLILLLGFEQ